MQIINTIKTLIATIKHWKQSALRIAFVPTMGNLHQGHLKLISQAKNEADKVVVSIFVNPTQFSLGEDFSSYPRTEKQDSELLEIHNVDVLFLPDVDEMYKPDGKTIISVTELNDLHCGASRVGHFNGVATIVCKLFNLIQPDIAFFGEKDYQQLAIIRAMVEDLNIPVEIKSVPTVRETDGLAMSSRNSYLTKEQRTIAPVLYHTLRQAYQQIITKQFDVEQIEQQQQKILSDAGFIVDYFSICHANTLLAAKPEDDEIVVLAAAKLGKTRLIDNIHFKINNLNVDSLD
jgi:pantoate--beta-alanine ligase